MKKDLLGFIIGSLTGLFLESLTLITFLGFSDVPDRKTQMSPLIYFLPGIFGLTAGPLLSFFISEKWKVALTVLGVLIVAYILIWATFTQPALPRIPPRF